MKYAIEIHRSAEHFLGAASKLIQDVLYPDKPALYDTLHAAEVRVKYLEHYFIDREHVTFKVIEYTKELL